MLRATLTPEQQKLWDATPINTDLSNELLLARMRVQKFQQMMSEGIVTVEGRINTATGLPKIWEVEDLLDRAMNQVNRLAVSQQAMHPETSATGSMDLSISINTGDQAIEDDDVPDLDADGTKDEAPAEDKREPQAAAPVVEPSALDGLDE